MKRPRPLGLVMVCAISAGVTAAARADAAEHSSSSSSSIREAAAAYGTERLEEPARVSILTQGQQRQVSLRERVEEKRRSVGAASVYARRLVHETVAPTPTPSAIAGGGVTPAPTPAATVIDVATASASTSASTGHYLSASTSASATFTTSSVDNEAGSSSDVGQGERIV